MVAGISFFLDTRTKAPSWQASSKSDELISSVSSIVLSPRTLRGLSNQRTLRKKFRSFFSSFLSRVRLCVKSIKNDLDLALVPSRVTWRPFSALPCLCEYSTVTSERQFQLGSQGADSSLVVLVVARVCTNANIFASLVMIKGVIISIPGYN
jgi:hypothetical protein